MKFRKYKSVPDYLEANLPKNTEVAKHFGKETLDSMMSNNLFLMRSALGVSQKDLAERLGVAQSAISKMENGGKNLSFSDTIRYLSALGFDVDLGIMPGKNVQARLDYHVKQINRILEELAELAGDDADITAGAVKTMQDMLAAIIRGIHAQFGDKLKLLTAEKENASPLSILHDTKPEPEPTTANRIKVGIA